MYTFCNIGRDVKFSWNFGWRDHARGRWLWIWKILCPKIVGLGLSKFFSKKKKLAQDFPSLYRKSRRFSMFLIIYTLLIIFTEKNLSKLCISGVRDFIPFLIIKIYLLFITCLIRFLYNINFCWDSFFGGNEKIFFQFAKLMGLFSKHCWP